MLRCSQASNLSDRAFSDAASKQDGITVIGSTFSTGGEEAAPEWFGMGPQRRLHGVMAVLQCNKHESSLPLSLSLSLSWCAAPLEVWASWAPGRRSILRQSCLRKQQLWLRANHWEGLLHSSSSSKAAAPSAAPLPPLDISVERPQAALRPRPRQTPGGSYLTATTPAAFECRKQSARC